MHHPHGGAVLQLIHGDGFQMGVGNFQHPNHIIVGKGQLQAEPVGGMAAAEVRCIHEDRLETLLIFRPQNVLQ